MQINLWYSESMNVWRWTLVNERFDMEAGSQPDLRVAMNDIANTVEHIISKSKQSK
jgi:hypothetical protein